MSEQGLHVKYNVTKVDTGELVGDCFVLRPDRDAAAVAALQVYAAVTDNKQLSYGILRWLDSIASKEKMTYTKGFLKAIMSNPELFEKLLSSIIESPHQNEHGDLWVSKQLASAICTELYCAVMDEKLSGDFDFQALTDKSDELLHIIF